MCVEVTEERRYRATPDGQVEATIIVRMPPEGIRKDIEKYTHGEMEKAIGKPEFRELERAIKEAERIQEIRNVGRK